MPKISVIIPVYNSQTYLDRCIQSILCQDYNDFELLLIDDGSSDSSGIICDRYAELDSRVKVFHKVNGGVSSARNLGLDNAIGEWVTFCDSDDWVYEGWLSTFLQQSDSCDLICQGYETDYSLMQGSSAIENKHLGFDYSGPIQKGLELLYEYGLVGTMVVKLFRRDIIRDNNLRLDEQFNYMEDEEFVLRYASFCKKMSSVKTIGYYYYSLGWQQPRKYSIKNSFKLYESLYRTAIAIFSTTSSQLIRYYLDEYTMALIDSFNKNLNLKLMKSYRQYVGCNVLDTNLYKLTRLVIYYDRTCLLSGVVMWLHCKLKSFMLRR